MNRSELRRRLAAEWQARGWEYDLTTGAAILDLIEASGTVDAKRLAKAVDAGFLKRAGSTRAEAEDAIEAAIGGEAYTPADEGPGGMVIHAGGDVFNLQMTGSTVQGNVNQGGTQVNVDIGSADDVMRAVAALVTGGLRGEWNPKLALAISKAIEGRDDVDAKQIEAAAIEVARKEKPEPGRIQKMLGDVAVSGVGSALSSGLTAALVQLPGLIA